MMNVHILITGTDTGVGKTFITYNLARGLIRRGYKVKCLKPIETYVIDVPEDGSLLARATGQSVDEVVPVKYSLPLSPYAAEIEEKKSFSLEKLKSHYERLKGDTDILLVEGAGGIAVPIKKNYTYVDLAKDWYLKVFIVARAGLGTLNHTFLTWHYAKSSGLEIIGIVLNGATGKDISERTNPQIVEEMTGIKPIVIPKVNGIELPDKFLENLVNYFLSGFKL